MLEEERRRAVAKQVENEAKTDENETKQSQDWLTSDSDKELNVNKNLKKETQVIYFNSDIIIFVLPLEVEANLQYYLLERAK